MHSRISQLMGIDYTFELLLSEVRFINPSFQINLYHYILTFFFQDGSGRGAALVAAVLKRDDNNDEQDITNGN